MPFSPKKANVWESIKVGCFAGAAEALLNHPLYVLKMRFQTENKSFRLYHGLLPNMSTMILLTGIRLSLSTFLTENLNKKTKFTDNQKKIISSFLGGAASSVLGSPLEFTRYRQLSTKSTFYKAMINLNREEGLKIFFYRLSWHSDKRFDLYHWFFSLAPIIKKNLENKENDSLRLIIFSGALAGTIAGIASQPFDMAKTYQQTKFKQGISLKSSFENIYKQHGLKGFFKGSFPRIARVTSGVAIISTINDQFNHRVSQASNFIRGPK